MSARNRLVITTPSDLEIEMTRDFDAPRALVWEMFTKPEHLKQWWGFGHVEVVTCELDFRVGGKYRYVGKTPDGNLVPFCGEHHEIVYPEKIVFTEIFDVDMAREHPSTVTVHQGRWAYCDSAVEAAHEWVPSGGVPLELLRRRSVSLPDARIA